MKINIIRILLLVSSFVSFSQTTDTLRTKSNPILFGEIYVGFVKGEIGYLSSGVGLKYQRKKDLFAFRYGFQEHYLNGSFLFVPTPIRHKYINEYALLYGRRKYDGNQSLSFSFGLSYNTFHENKGRNSKDDVIWETTNTGVGFPFEFNIKWFKSKKKRFRVLYGTIPVGKKTSFGRSFGIKIQGNITEKSYFGMALVYGLGWHKKY